MAVTLKEIAEKAGVSIRSVTRALKGQDGLAEKKRQEIVEIASRLGYVPNVAARNLRMRKSNFIGIVNSPNSNEIWQRKMVDLQARLEHQGFFPLVGLFHQNPAELQAMLRDWAGIVDTVVFFAWYGGAMPEKVLHGLPQRFIFADCLTQGQGNGFGTVINIDRSVGIKTGVVELIERGYRRIGRCGNNNMARAEGFDGAFENVPSNQVERLFFNTEKAEFADGYKMGNEIVLSGVDAVFFDTDRLALGFLKYAYENDVKIPQDIAVIGFDDDMAGIYSCPSLSSVAHPIAEINGKIVELMKKGDENTGQFIYPTTFIRRESI
jgi:DNA-binding LacI/PurR family transcriptional regulator